MDDESQPAVEQVSRAKRLAAAFNSVFGQGRNRSTDQKLVVDHLRAMCGRDSAVFQADKEGRFDALRAAQIDGAQTQYLIIKRQLAIYARSAEEPKKKIVAKK